MAEDDWTRDKEAFVEEPPDAPHPASDQISSPLAREFTRLTEQLLTADNVGDVLTYVVDATVAVIPAADLVSLTLQTEDDKLHTPATNHPDGEVLDEMQQRFSEGPCYDAARLSGPGFTHSPDLTESDQWPKFSPEATSRGYVSVLSTSLVPGMISTRLSGALNIFSRERGRLGDPATVGQALLLATHMSLALARTEAVLLGELRATQLRRALETRDVIGQAKGILMQRRGIGADEAFDQLRRISQDLNIKLADLAGTLAARHREIDLPPR